MAKRNATDPPTPTPSPTPTQAKDKLDGLYGEPAIYDILHTPHTSWEVGGLVQIAQRFLGAEREPSSMTWLEPACGTGRYLREAARKGVRVVGFDRSEAMIAYALERIAKIGPKKKPHLFVGDMVGFESQIKPASVDMAFNLINTIRHLPSDKAMLEHFAGIRAALKPGGIYVVGISLSAYGREQPDEDVWSGKRGRVHVTQIVNYEPASNGTGPGSRVEMVYSHMMVQKPSGLTHYDDSYGLRSYNLAQWRSIVSRGGFERIATIDELGEDVMVLEPGYALHVLRPKL